MKSRIIFVLLMFWNESLSTASSFSVLDFALFAEKFTVMLYANSSRPVVAMFSFVVFLNPLSVMAL